MTDIGMARKFEGGSPRETRSRERGRKDPFGDNSRREAHKRDVPGGASGAMGNVSGFDEVEKKFEKVIIGDFFDMVEIRDNWVKSGRETAKELARIEGVLLFIEAWPEWRNNHRTMVIVLETLRALGLERELGSDERKAMIRLVDEAKASALKWGKSWKWCASVADEVKAALETVANSGVSTKTKTASLRIGADDAIDRPAYDLDESLLGVRLEVMKIMRDFWLEQGISFRWLGAAEAAADKVAKIDGMLDYLLSKECAIANNHHRVIYVAIRAAGKLAAEADDETKSEVLRWLGSKLKRAERKGWSSLVYAAQYEIALLRGELSEKAIAKHDALIAVVREIRPEDYQKLNGWGLKQFLVTAMGSGDVKQQRKDIEEVARATADMYTGGAINEEAGKILEAIFRVIYDYSEPEATKRITEILNERGAGRFFYPSDGS